MTKPVNRPVRVADRQRGALTRLEAQLVAGTKLTANGSVPLTNEDRVRIKAEIKTLRYRIASAPISNPITKKLLLTATEERKAHRHGVLSR